MYVSGNADGLGHNFYGGNFLCALVAIATNYISYITAACNAYQFNSDEIAEIGINSLQSMRSALPEA